MADSVGMLVLSTEGVFVEVTGDSKKPEVHLKRVEAQGQRRRMDLGKQVSLLVDVMMSLSQHAWEMMGSV